MADGTLQRVTSDLCNPEVKPATKEECHEADCTGIWVAGPWGKVKYIFSNVRDLIQVVTYFDCFQCSKPCDGGEQSRVVMCINGDGVVDATNCDVMHQLTSKESCNTNVSCSDGTSKHDVTTP